MALQKEIKLENGVILNYHRISSLNKITNIVNNIEVSSYTSKEQREKEKDYQELQMRNANQEELTDKEQKDLEKGINVLVEADYIQIPYDENMTIEDAYEYLKTLDRYKNSKKI